MFDYNGDGKTDTGEQFIGHEIFKDVTGGFTPRTANKLDGFTIFSIVIVAWQILNLIANAMY